MTETFRGQIIVSDLMGNDVIREDLNSTQLTLSLNNLLAKGIYFARILDAEGNVLEVKKFIYQ